MKLTNEDVQEILQLLDATPYDEMHLETKRFKLTLRRNRDSGQWTQESQVLSAPNIIRASPVQTAAPAADAATATAAARPADSQKTGWIEVRAHLPGTFYRAPKPGAPPFVEIGSHVEEDTVVCIIETMKLMNAVHAQTRGEVVELCLENAQLVEKGAVLMRIQPGAP
ncbi:MAG TPA: biotin/lipoyl-containing protein [Candidatus Acidoferrum sp.]|nr:biotin/lipoyl-containing protein [Candidatus Acidoferrum sp.]